MTPAKKEDLISYLRTLNEEELNLVLAHILTEQRARDADKIKKDFLTHSQSLAIIRRSK